MATIDSSDAFKYHWAFSALYGLKHVERRHLVARLAYYTFSSLMVVFGLVFPVIAFVVFLFQSRTAAEFCDNFAPTVTALFCTVKFAYFVCIRRKFLALSPLLHALDSRALATDELATLRRAVGLSDRCFKVYMVIGLAVSLSAPLVVFLSSEPVIAFAAWYPLDWRKSYTNYAIVNAYQFYSAVSVALQNCVCDTYPPGLMSVLSGHIQALGLRVRKFQSNTDGTHSRAYKELIACHKDHLQILELYERIQEIVSFTCFAQFICTSVAQIACAVYILFFDLEFSKLMQVVFLFTGCTAETLLLCYFGDSFKQDMEFLSRQVYFSNWVGQDIAFQQGVLLFLIRAQNSKQIRSGYFIPVDLVMRTTYSFFALFNNLK